MLPDTGERYLSTPLFGEIGEEMTEEELAISRSTPGYRFDAPAPAADNPAEAEESGGSDEARDEPVAVTLDTNAEQFVNETIATEPVVLFALEWCEFCWSVRKLFSQLGIDYRSVDLDSVDYQKDNLGGRIRGVLTAKTGARTIPQIFIGGEHIGGCTELFDGWRDGTIRRRLDVLKVDFQRSVEIDPYGLLPKWLQPRKSA